METQSHKYNVLIDKWSPYHYSRHDVFFNKGVLVLDTLELIVTFEGCNDVFRIPLTQVKQFNKESFDLVVLFKGTDCWRFRFDGKLELADSNSRLQQIYDASPVMRAITFELDGLEKGPFVQSTADDMFNRLKLPHELFRISDVNKDFKLSEYLPENSIVPKTVEDSMLKNISQFRALNKFPHLVYYDHRSTATLIRSSQPLVGLKTKRNIEDEQFVSLFLYTDTNKGNLVDLRTKSAAISAKNKGGGNEAETGTYSGIKMFFTNIELPVVISDIYLKFSENIILRGKASMSSYLNDTGLWLKQVQSCLRPSLFISKSISQGTSVMIHCDDGIDASCVVTSLVKIISCPFYRTIKGFLTLIQEDWLDEGFKFFDRCGRVKSSSNSYYFTPNPESDSLAESLSNQLSNISVDNTSVPAPVFTLFVDCVYQIWSQYPTEFEFIPELLLLLNHHTTSCQFGTFLFNTQKERQEISKETYSLFSYILNTSVNDKLTKFYKPQVELLEISINSKRLEFFSGLYDAFDENNKFSAFHEAKWFKNNMTFDKKALSSYYYESASRRLDEDIFKLQDEVKKLKDDKESKENESLENNQQKIILVCTCGQPLCICELNQK